MPKWEDEAMWKRHFENGYNFIYSYENGDSRKTYLTPKEFRDACYDIISRTDKNFDSCSPHRGYCTSCLMEKGWYGGSYENEK